MIRFRLILLFILFQAAGYANIPHFKTDSLKNIVQAELSAKGGNKDTSAINHLNKLAAAYTDSYPDSTLLYGQTAINLARKIKYEKGIAEGLVRTGKIYYFKGKYDKASVNLDEARLLYLHLNDEHGLAHVYDELGHMYNRVGNYNLALKTLNTGLAIATRLNDQEVLAQIYVDMGTVSDNMGRSSIALTYYFISLTIDIRLNNKLEMARNYNDIGVILQNMEIYPKALEYYRKCLKIWQDAKDEAGLGTAYENIGEVSLSLKKYNEAIDYLQRSLVIALKQDDKDGISSLYTDLGLCYGYKKNFKQALYYLNLGLKTSTDSKIDYNRANAYVYFAIVYNLMGDYQEAYNYATKGKTLADKLGSLKIRSNAALELSKALGGLKIFDKAYIAQKEYDDLKDSLKSDENVQKLTSYNLEENYAEKQRQQELQQQEREQRYQQNLRAQKLLLAVFLAIILGMFFVALTYYRGRKKQERINAELAQKNSQILQQKTDLDEQAAKLNDLNTLKDRLISILAHDLRAPLSTLRGLFNLLQDSTLTLQEVLEMIPQVLKRLEYTSDFLDTLLFWINSQMDNFDSSAKDFDLLQLVEGEAINHYDQAKAKGINLINSIPENIITSADPNSIRIVIRNLITNAIKFSRRDDSITISTHMQADSSVQICITDTGIGMQPEQLSKLFKGKVNSGTGTNNETGTGMGLLFCKDLIERSNGKIWVTSEPGKGTKFCFTLPIASAQQTQKQSAGRQTSLQL